MVSHWVLPWLCIGWYCSLVADGIANNIFTGRCYKQCVCSGGMTTHGRYYVVADGKPLAECWQMLQQCGRWNGHFWVHLFQFRFWDVKQNLIPYVRQLVFAYVLVEGWIVHPYVYCFFDSSDQVLVLSPHNAEVLNGGTLTSGVKMVIYWGRGLQVFSVPLSKSSWWLPYIFIITFHPVAFVSVDNATLLCDGIFVFRSCQKAFDGITSLAVYLNPMFSAYIFYALTQPFYIWDHHIGPLIASCSISTDVSSPLVLVLLWGCTNLHFFTLFRAHIGYLYSSRTLWRWSSSFSSSW